jgi:hypothetical protein
MSMDRDEDWFFRHGAEHVASNRRSVACKLCAAETTLFDVVDFGRQCSYAVYPDGLAGVAVYYRKCSRCNLIFTDFFDHFTPEQWARHVYNSDYIKIDPEYLDVRPRANVAVAQSATQGWWSPASIGCDFGGGSGLMAKELTRRGIRFDCMDPFGETFLSAKPGQYSLVTAFEVVEHLPDPLGSFAEIAGLASKKQSLIVMSTTLNDVVSRPGDLIKWWYAAPRNGHITLYAEESMRFLAQKHGFEYARIRGLHLMGRNIALAPIGRRILLAKIKRKLGLGPLSPAAAPSATA